MSAFRGWHALLLLVVALLVLVGLGVPVETGRADSETLGFLWLNPPFPSAAVGTSTTLALQLDNVTNVVGAEVHLEFDPAFLEVVGDAVIPGTCPEPNFVVANTADNTAGTIDYTVTQLAPTPPCAGGLVADIEFRCKAETSPSTEVSIVSSTISDPDGVPIDHVTEGATITCLRPVFLPLVLRDY